MRKHLSVQYIPGPLGGMFAWATALSTAHHLPHVFIDYVPHDHRMNFRAIMTAGESIFLLLLLWNALQFIVVSIREIMRRFEAMTAKRLKAVRSDDDLA